jgi:hypothetical protein
MFVSPVSAWHAYSILSRSQHSAQLSRNARNCSLMATAVTVTPNARLQARAVCGASHCKPLLGVCSFISAAG